MSPREAALILRLAQYEAIIMELTKGWDEYDFAHLATKVVLPANFKEWIRKGPR